MIRIRKLQIALILLLGVLHLITNAQSKFPIKVAISNESTAIPFTKLFTTPFHPTFQVGTEYLYKKGLHFELYQTANLGYIFHNYLYQGIYLNSEIGYDYIFDFGLKLKSNFGLGYLHTFSTQDEFQLKNGEYINGTDWGNSRLMPILSLGFGYLLKNSKSNSSEIYILYKSWIEYPYSPGFIPVMSHINLEIGYKFYLKSHDKK